jgi:hypothetical protein
MMNETRPSVLHMIAIISIIIVELLKKGETGLT